MEPNDPPPRKAEQPEDVLRRLEERLGRASEAAERLMSEAARSAGSPHSRAKEPDASRSAGSPHYAGLKIQEEVGPAAANPGWQRMV